MSPDTLFDSYKKIQGKFNLPQLNDLSNTFKFDLDENDELDDIRSELSDRLFSFTEKIVEPLIAGSDALCCMYEQDMITDKDRARLFELYKKIQMLKWENNLLVVRPSDERIAKWIRKTWDFWNNELEKELSDLCERLALQWQNLKIKSEKVHYTG